MYNTAYYVWQDFKILPTHNDNRNRYCKESTGITFNKTGEIKESTGIVLVLSNVKQKDDLTSYAKFLNSKP